MSPRSRTPAAVQPVREHRTLRLTAAAAVLALVLPILSVLTLLPSAASAATAAAPAFKVLVFSKTTGFRHDSIPEGIAAIQKLGQENNFAVDATEDSTQFTDENLAQYQAVIFLSTTGDPLGTQDQKDAFQRYIQVGGGFAGIHAASDGGYEWPWFGKLVGGYFKSHPAIQQATVKVEDPAHPSTEGLPTSWVRTDEWYDYRANPRDDVHVLASMDETSYSGATMGIDHPTAWCQDYDGGRSWYTGLGHTKESFVEPSFLSMLLGGIRTAAGAVEADCSASQSESFEKVTLDDNTSNPMMLDVAKDGRVFYIDRLGDVKIAKTTGGSVTAAHLNVFTANESGLLGLALDPGFDSNHQLYLYYSPAGENVDRLSRFTVTGDSLDLSSEQKILDVPVQRAECCHHGGGMIIDPKTGDLWLATGDNTNPFASDGYAPIDEREGRASWDAQRTSANTNSLSGKLLRIHPEADGTYTVPSGNLFPPGTQKTKPEIYGMGFRNPFRMGLDPKTGRPMLAEYGPDAGSASPARGPENTVEWNLIAEPGNYGWPYCVGDNKPFIDYDFATKESGSAFDCDAPVNNSPNNDGLTDLPQVTPATVWYHYNTDPQNFPELNGGAPMAGPVYRYDAGLQSPVKWPAYWDGKAIFGEWNNNEVFSFQLNEDTSGLVKINQILKSLSFKKPMDMKFGPDGALYMIEWGSGFGGDNADSGIYRIEYTKGDRPPVARITADKTDGPVPLTVQFSSEGTRDPDNKPLTYAWDFDDDGTADSSDPSPSHTYTTAGEYNAVLTVTNTDGVTATAGVPIVAGNTKPTITLLPPPHGGFFEFGDQVRYKVVVTDPEDGTIDCAEVQVQALLGHEGHGHPLDQDTGCEGVLQTLTDGGHGTDDNLFYIIEATYADHGAGDAPSLTGRGQVILQPKRKQAEHFTETGRVADGTGTDTPGVQVETTTDPQGGSSNIGFIQDGDWWSISPANLGNIDAIRFRASSAGAGGTVQVRLGDPENGTLVGSADVPVTGGWQQFTDVTLELDDPPAQTGPLYFVVRKPASAANDAFLANFNWVDFVGKGVTENQRPTVTASANPASGTAPLTVDFTATAADPEGDEPLTYRWNFGVNGAPQPETAEASHTYTAPGTYTATVTVTDAKGAVATAQVPIKVDAPTTQCLTGRSDDFLGTELDSDRWSVTREDQNLKVADGKLVLPTSTTDIYGAGGNTPNIVVQPAPPGPWTATAKLTLDARDQYQQAGLILYGDDDNYAKMVLQGRGTDDHASRIFQFIREENGTPNEVAESNTALLGDAYPDTVYVRFISDGTNITAHYSADGVTFTAMPQTKPLAGIDNPKIGLLSLAGAGNPVVDASFDWFHITPDDTATKPGPDDEFDGTAIDGCRWDASVRHDPSSARVTGGNLEIDTQAGDIYGTDNNGAKNFILQTAPDGDWTLETKIDGSAFNEAFQQGGLVVYAGDDDYVKFDYITDNSAGSAITRRIELRSEVGGTVQDPQPQVGNLTSGVWWLRLQKEGDAFHGFYASDGTTWTEIGAPTVVRNSVVADGAKVGLFAFGAGQTASKTATFDYFHLSAGEENDDTTAPVTTATTDPAQPENGWFTQPVQVTLAAADEGSGVDRTEYLLDGGDWTGYAEPVLVSGDGSHTLAYRSADKAGNVEEAKTLTVEVDATAPATTATSAPANDDGWHNGAVPVTLAATDETSGVASTEYALDGGDWAPYTEAVDVSGEGQHELRYRSTDKAGNVEETKAVTLKIDTQAPTVLITGVAAGTQYGDSQDLKIAWEAVDSGSGIKTVTGTLDGGPYESGTVTPMYELSLGEHTITVTAVNKAGNRTDQTVTFSVVTSTADIAGLIERFEVAGKLTAKNADKLQKSLDGVRKAEEKKDKKIIKELEKFEKTVNDKKVVSDDQVRTTLLRDADALIAQYAGTPKG
ncbi:ThuA domain-containing protein [Nonomuraea sp. K274]|uniref:ThuA domain-containing protein n=1 Tax=Nonomuraea cypriaca TaxID=1187855 RepID=A0A931A9I8_9ACTN|nr:ThuA domain-containing protein [Nonomuraea cypriaca]MBF8187134.1 ThuA domain-containing protein [Nonomuraea cypriaca]